MVGTYASALSVPAIFAVLAAVPGLCNKQTTAIIAPETYLSASAQALALTLAISWTFTYYYNPSVIESNPLKDRTAYNNFCVGWDTPPAVYPAAFFMTAC